VDLKTRFLFRFYGNDTKITMDKLLSAIQKGGESVRNYIERFHNFSLICSTGMPLPMLLQTCRHNFLDGVKVRTRAVKAHTGKEFVEQAEIAEKSSKKFEPSVSRTNGGSTVRDKHRSNQSDINRLCHTISFI